MNSRQVPKNGKFRPSNRGAPLSAMILPLLLSLFSPVAIAPNSSAQETQSEMLPEEIWSTEYINQQYPWGGDDRAQFREYHDYFSLKNRMQFLADRNPEIMTFHEGLLGGVNKRGDQMSATDYEGWYYNHRSPWIKITQDPSGGDCNIFVGDCGNYEDRADVMLVGNHHAREWMSFEVPMFFLEMVAHYYGQAGVDNDGDGSIDEDP